VKPTVSLSRDNHSSPYLIPTHTRLRNLYTAPKLSSESIALSEGRNAMAAKRDISYDTLIKLLMIGDSGESVIFILVSSHLRRGGENMSPASIRFRQLLTNFHRNDWC
jgi:hypothetical protein